MILWIFGDSLDISISSLNTAYYTKQLPCLVSVSHTQVNALGARSRALSLEIQSLARNLQATHSGLFSGKYTSLEKPAKGRFSDRGNLGAIYTARNYNPSTMEALSIIEVVTKEHGDPLVEVGTTVPTVENCGWQIRAGTTALFSELVRMLSWCRMSKRVKRVPAESKGIPDAPTYYWR